MYFIIIIMYFLKKTFPKQFIGWSMFSLIVQYFNKKFQSLMTRTSIWIIKHLWSKYSQSFKTRISPAGWPATRAWDRFGWRKKPAWKLARRNSIDPGLDLPGQTRVRPDHFFLYILAVIKRRHFGLLKGQYAKYWKVKKNEAICKPN